MNKYDVLIIGSGLTGAMIAYANRGRKVLVLERKDSIGGFCRTENRDGIDIHLFGPHIFHTNERKVWDWINSITPFIPFNLNIKATSGGRIYSLPPNMNTFYELYGTSTPKEAEEAYREHPEVLIDTLIRGYTEKQWGRSFEDVENDVINRLPIRFTYDNNYYRDAYVGIPLEGYTRFIERLLEGSEVQMGVDFLQDKEYYTSLADEVLYTGSIDEYYAYCYGRLEYRCVTHEHTKLKIQNYQGCPIMNYTSKDVPYTRVIEHKHFIPGKITESTWISKEYPSGVGDPAYPVRDKVNLELYEKYRSIPGKVRFCGRLGEYKYYDMNNIIEKYL